MKNQLPKISILLSAILLTACGGSDNNKSNQNNPPEKPTTVVNQEGRLLIINDQVDRPELSLFDLEQQKVIDVKQLKTMPFALHSSPSTRYGILMDRVGGTVNFYDSGLSDKGTAAPQLLNFQLNGAAPTHYRNFNGQAAIFYDGSETETSKFDVFTDAGIASKNVASQKLPFKHHGVAEPLGEYVLSSYSGSGETLASVVRNYELHGDHFHGQNNLQNTCPGLHGASSVKGYSAFGCEDGVLLVEHGVAGLFKDSKIKLDVRIGTVVGQANAQELVGLASATPDLFIINGANKLVQQIPWTEKDTNVKRLQQTYSQSGDYFVILDSLGQLVILDTESWTVKHRIQLIEQGSEAIEKAALIAHGQQDRVFINNVVTKQIHEIDLKSAKIERSIKLDAVPQKFTWLGVAK